MESTFYSWCKHAVPGPEGCQPKVDGWCPPCAWLKERQAAERQASKTLGPYGGWRRKKKKPKV